VEDSPCQGLSRSELLAPPTPPPEGEGLADARYPFTISAADQYSRAPTDLPTPEQGACALLTDASPAGPFSRALARAGTGELGTDARSPLPAARTPGDDAIGRRVHLLRDASTSPVRGAARFFFYCGLRPVRACSAASEPVGRIADALCRAPDTTRRSEPALGAPRTHPLAVRQHRAVVSPEHLPSTDPSPVRRASPSRNRRPPLLPRLGRRGTASDMG
jgi:hypothetical protein